MTTDIRININATLSCASDKNLAIEKIKLSYKYLLDLWDREKMTARINYDDHDGIDITIQSFDVDVDYDYDDDDDDDES